MFACGVQRDVVLSRKCDYPPLLLVENQNVRNICLTVRWRCAGGRASSYRHPQRHAIVILPWLTYPLLASARLEIVLGKGVGNNKTASETRQKGAKIGLVLLGGEKERS